MKEEDVLKSLAGRTHLGGTDFGFPMEEYIYHRKSDGIYIINEKRTWEKLWLAALAIVTVKNTADVSVISSRKASRKAVLKFAAATGTTPIAGCVTPGTFTDQIQAAFPELRRPVATDPGLSTSLSQRCLMLACLPPLSRTLLCTAWTLPSV